MTKRSDHTGRRRPAALMTALLLVVLATSPGLTADEPDLIFKRSTVFKWLTPNDKLATYGLDDPEINGVACHFTVPEKGGLKGGIGVAEEFRHLARLPAGRSDPVQEEIHAGRGRVSRSTLAILQEDADCSRMRHQAQRAGLYGILRSSHRRLPEKLDFLGSGDALGQYR
jgi:hypothetical protein